MATLGFVGLGAMGGRVTKRLLDAGHSVTGYNRTRSKAQWLIDAGLRWGESPRAVAEAADVVFTMVTNTAALEAVVEGPDGILAGLGPGKVYVDMSTVSPAKSRALAELVAGKGARMLDAPVSGSVVTLEQGKLSMMVGGEREHIRAGQADPRGYRADGQLCRRERAGRADEDRRQPQPAGAGRWRSARACCWRRRAASRARRR